MGSCGSIGSWKLPVWTCWRDPSRPRFLTRFEELESANPIAVDTMVPDAAGNPATINGETLVWNAQNMLVARGNTLPKQLASGVNYLDWSGKRVMRWFPPTALIYVGDDFEYDSGLGMGTKHFFLQGERVAARSVFYTAQSAWLPPLAYRWLLEPLRAAAPVLVLGALALGLLSLLLLVGFGVPVPAWVGAPAVGLLAAALVLYPTSAAYAVIGTGGGPEWHGGHSKPLVIYGNDHLGSTRVVIDAAGETLETRDYAPFGKTVAHTGAYDLRHRFTSQPWDDAGIGLYDYGARMYEPRWGRFLSPDEMVQGFDSQGLNGLAYVGNQPTSRIDPTGSFYEGAGSGVATGGLGGIWDANPIHEMSESCAGDCGKASAEPPPNSKPPAHPPADLHFANDEVAHSDANLSRVSYVEEPDLGALVGGDTTESLVDFLLRELAKLQQEETWLRDQLDYNFWWGVLNIAVDLAALAFYWTLAGKAAHQTAVAREVAVREERERLERLLRKNIRAQNEIRGLLGQKLLPLP